MVSISFGFLFSFPYASNDVRWRVRWSVRWSVRWKLKWSEITASVLQQQDNFITKLVYTTCVLLSKRPSSIKNLLMKIVESRKRQSTNNIGRMCCLISIAYAIANDKRFDSFVISADCGNAQWLCEIDTDRQPSGWYRPPYLWKDTDGAISASSGHCAFV